MALRGSGSSWPTGGGYSSGWGDSRGSGWGNSSMRTKKGSGKKSPPVAEVPVDDLPEVDPIEESEVQNAADLARFFADGVRAATGEYWSAPWWVRSWFAEHEDWVFVTSEGGGPQYEIPATPQLWVSVINAFFDPTRKDPACGNSGPALWSEFRYWAREVDLLDVGVVKVRYAELSAKTKVLLDRARAHGVEFDPQPEKDARAALHKAQEALREARAGRSSRKTVHRLQEAVEDAEGDLHDVIVLRDRELTAAGFPPKVLMDEHRRRKRVLGLAQANVKGHWQSDRTDARVESRGERPVLQDPAARKRAREAEERALRDFLASDEYAALLEQEVDRLLEARDRSLEDRFEEESITDEQRRKIMAEEEEEDPDPGSELPLAPSLDVASLLAKLHRTESTEETTK